MEEHTSGYPSENSADVHVEKTRLGYIHGPNLWTMCSNWGILCPPNGRFNDPTVKGKGIIYAGHDCLQKLSTKFYILKHDVLDCKIHIWIGIFSFNIVNLLLNWSKSCFKCFKKIICRMEFILTEENFFINKWEIVTFGVFFFFLENVKFNVTWKTLQEEGSLTNSFNFNTKLEFIIIEI